MGMAMAGAPLDSWGRLGLFHRNRRPEFKSFEAVTQGLSDEDKKRFHAILTMYRNDIHQRSPDFTNHHFELETLSHARDWVEEMLRSAGSAMSAEVVSKVSKPAIDEIIDAEDPDQMADTQDGIMARLKAWLNGLIRRDR